MIILQGCGISSTNGTPHVTTKNQNHYHLIMLTVYSTVRVERIRPVIENQ
ncbi:UNVERIFIED_ORG: hypothetical protein [Escherichia phage CMSTMSU]